MQDGGLRGVPVATLTALLRRHKYVVEKAINAFFDEEEASSEGGGAEADPFLLAANDANMHESKANHASNFLAHASDGGAESDDFLGDVPSHGGVLRVVQPNTLVPNLLTAGSVGVVGQPCALSSVGSVDARAASARQNCMGAVDLLAQSQSSVIFDGKLQVDGNMSSTKGNDWHADVEVFCVRKGGGNCSVGSVSGEGVVRSEGAQPDESGVVNCWNSSFHGVRGHFDCVSGLEDFSSGFAIGQAGGGSAERRPDYEKGALLHQASNLTPILAPVDEGGDQELVDELAGLLLS